MRRLIALACVVLAGCTFKIEVLPNVRIEPKPETRPAQPTNYMEQWERIR